MNNRSPGFLRTCFIFPHGTFYKLINGAKLFVHFTADGYMWGYIEYHPPYTGAPKGIQTHNRLIRNQNGILYPRRIISDADIVLTIRTAWYIIHIYL
jgi:hypothetical protein